VFLLQAAEEKPAGKPPATAVDYTTQIKPLFIKHCVACHSGEDQQSGYRLDTGKLAVFGGDRGASIVPGKSSESNLFQALIGKGDVTQMPMDKPPLKKEEIQLIKLWIDQGAKFPQDEVASAGNYKGDHWSFQKVARPEIPNVKNRAWVRNPIDAFIVAKLEAEGLSPSVQADRSTLIRRLSLDLLGLLPTPDEVEEFIADDDPQAYEQLVDRLLASPKYGERWGRHWLDLARYADSNGFTIDGARSIWKYRDWVVDALNRDLPFDEFTTEQLAADLFPNPSTEQLTATGFHRNTLVNQEGGTDNEQFRVEATIDRVNTTGTVFMGLSVGCGQCHAHKFDPLSQREYYQLFAFFNNCQDVNSIAPTLSLPSKEQSAKQKELRAAIASAEKPLKAHDAEFLKGLPAWEKSLTGQKNATVKWDGPAPLENKGEKGSLIIKQDDLSLFVDFSAPNNDTYVIKYESKLPKITAIRLEALTHPSLPMKGPGRAGNGNFVLTGFELLATPLGSDGEAKPVKITKAIADHSQEGYPVSHTLDGKTETGWAINVKKGSSNVNREAIFFPEQPLESETGFQVTIKLGHLNIKTPKYTLGRFRLSFSDVSPELLSVPQAIRDILAVEKSKRTEAQMTQLETAFKQTDAVRPPLAAKVAELKKQEKDVSDKIPTTMVYRDAKKPRQTHIHIRGDFLRKGAKVSANVPSAFGSLPDKVKNANRLDLARWLLSPENPLTSRVTVNRYWQRFFGVGIVETENDFGKQGSTPTHQGLLDWLSAEFLSSGWQVKSMHRLIVTSATYRQSSRISKELLAKDSRNYLLARQSRVRLEAEAIRDISLSTSGHLSQNMFGPGVYPPQPEGIYVLTQVKKTWPESKGADRYRRGLYTYFWRSSPYPFLPTFDAPEANVSCTRRARSNTPLQALTLANDRVFFELAQGLAARILRDGPDYDEGKLRHAFRVCLSREPSDAELKRLSQFVQQQKEHYQSATEDAKAVAPKTLPKETTVAEAAAWTTLSRVLLNLDEFITRE